MLKNCTRTIFSSQQNYLYMYIRCTHSENIKNDGKTICVHYTGDILPFLKCFKNV